MLGPGRNADDFVRANGRFVEEIMTRDPISVSDGTPVEEVVALMEKHRIKRVPVLQGDRVVGVVSRADLLRALSVVARGSAGPAPDARKTVGPVGTASTIKKGSMNEANCATRIRYTSRMASSNPIPKLLNEESMVTTNPRTSTRISEGRCSPAMILEI